jgi:glycosyltransferase involved in cell wall biosynthesis
MNERKFSFVMTCYDQAQELEANLPAFLTQEYEPGYEVIVVDESSTDETEDVLKLFKNDYKHLYTTFLPKPNIPLFRKKFAFNIGTKASKNEWIIFTNISNRLVANDILKAVNDNLSSDAQLTLGYHLPKGIRLQPFATIDEAESLILKGERRLTKIRERKHLKYTWGRYDFIIIHKDNVVELLKYYEQRVSASRLLGIRLGIFFGNLLRRGSTTQLVTT